MGKRIKLPPAPMQQDTEAMSTWYSRVRDSILKVSGDITWSNLDFTGSNLTDVVTRNHNDLQNIQGGSTSQRYHITSGQNQTISTLSWNSTDGTVDIDMGLGPVTQQVGLEQYMVIKNNTGSTISNGKGVGFAGAASSRILGQYYTANGTMPSLYFIGVATMDIPNGTEGYVTTYGYVRDIDTSAWAVGDVLYASPSIAGAFTNVKPTVPNLVVPVAAVLSSHATTGVIVVRPTITLSLSYGSFQDSTTQTPAAINTAYAITFNTTDTSNGVSRGSPTSRIVVANSGQYDFNFSHQVETSSASTKTLYFWIRKNGVDIADSTRKVTIAGNTEIIVPSWNYHVSLNANDYVELMWAADSTNVSLTPASATAFAPSSASTKLNVSQVNQ